MSDQLRMLLAILVLLFVISIDVSDQLAFPSQAYGRRGKSPPTSRNITFCKDGDCSDRLIDHLAFWRLLKIRKKILTNLKFPGTRIVSTPRPTVTVTPTTINVSKIPILISLSEYTSKYAFHTLVLHTLLYSKMTVSPIFKQLRC